MLQIIYFIKSDKAKKNGECPIYAKIQFQRQTITMSTKQSITPSRWSFTNNLRNPLKLEKEKVIKASLDSLNLSFERKINELIRANSAVNLNEIRKDITGKPKKKKKEVGLLDIFEKHNKSFERKVDAGERSSASLQKYKRSKTLIEDFIKKEYGKDNISIDSVKGAFIYNLESYLKYESVYKGKVGIKNNSVVKYFKNFKTVCNYGIKLDIITKNPFSKYDGKLKVKDAVFLTKAELLRIEEKSFDIVRLQRVRDIFLFSCYTGYAPIDEQSLTRKNLIQNNEGDYWIVTDRVKTGIRANVPVLPTTLRIIKKYQDLQKGLIPKLSNQKMNAYLKEIADVCGIHKKLTWYTARHTFATTVTLGNGIRMENVSAMMGHSNIQQTQHYAKVLDSSVNDDMGKIKDIYK
ncbi:site-specific integrase [Psychroflexus sp. MES1-P1E]|uniref:site-specific integrase n=1 Tax=Psychroflexus sp. MES1-P1E TaxID=2058320 RepID=UPI000C7BB0AC|nr:site-specific integrase [Psychroflexus sp. MES1-P1E]PKG44023.1 tyrosine type site-specific recombinase [Psychroflexus sp. MES1-P1E]